MPIRGWCNRQHNRFWSCIWGFESSPPSRLTVTLQSPDACTAPSSSGPGRRPLKAVTAVRICSGLPHQRVRLRSGSLRVRTRACFRADAHRATRSVAECDSQQRGSPGCAARVRPRDARTRSLAELRCAAVGRVAHSLVARSDVRLVAMEQGVLTCGASTLRVECRLSATVLALNDPSFTRVATRDGAKSPRARAFVASRRNVGTSLRARSDIFRAPTVMRVCARRPRARRKCLTLQHEYVSMHGRWAAE